LRSCGEKGAEEQKAVGEIMNDSDVAHALRDLIRGDGVRRASHDLRIAGRDVTDLFRKLLASEGYVPMPVEEIPIETGERVPAFVIAEGVAHFGWVFWEVFSPGRKRKLFGSQAKNSKGDWALVLARRAAVYACLGRRESMDTDRPSSL
jgi:hypothetical protein